MAEAPPPDDPKKDLPPQATPTPPEAAADKPAGASPVEPIAAEVSRTDAPGAGVSAAPVAPARTEPPAPKPANPAAATTAATSETSSATGQPTPTAQAAAAAKAAPAPGAAKPAPAPGAAKPAAAPKPAAEHPPKAAPPAGPVEPPPPADLPVPAFITTLQSAMPGAVTLVSYFVGDWTVVVPAAQAHDVARYLKTAPDAAFDFCSDVTATDWPPRAAERFDVIYCLYSTTHRHRVRLKTRASETTPIPSVTDLWPAADWLEREVFDMFGINITGHPDRRRILMPEDWQGYPQRKDYPLEGPGELLMENPQDWLKLKQTREEADIE